MLKQQRRRQMALDDEEEDDEPQLIDEDDIAPPNKRQKTGDTTSKATKNGSSSRDGRKRKESSKSHSSDDTKEEKKTEDDKDKDKDKEKEKETPKDSPKDSKKKKKGKDKKMQNMKGGIKFRDMKIGGGDVIKPGDKVRVFYVGQLDDKKVFDKCISGQGFEFNLGKGDVIKGWDMGVKGMRVGGKRKLVIPPKLGYGQAGSPPQIGSNATLTFTIEIKGVSKN